MSLKVTIIKNNFDYTTGFSTEIEFNEVVNESEWRDAFINIKMESPYFEVNGKNIGIVEFSITGTGQRVSLMKAFEHFAEVLKTDLDDYLKRESNDPLLRP
jgi:septin family protein